MPPRKAAAAKPVVIEEEEDIAEAEEAIEETLAEAPTDEIPADLEDKLFEELGLDLGEDEWEDEDENYMGDQSNPEDVIAKKKDVMVHMRHGYSYTSPEYEFTREEPYQLMNSIDAERLMKQDPEKWEYATKEQVAEFYASR